MSLAVEIPMQTCPAHVLRPNPVFNRTPCGSPRVALISLWAKRGLPQGAG